MFGTRSSTSPPPLKRRRHPSDANRSNGSPSHATTLPPLSLSILGVEPVDEFIKAVADFVHYMIHTRPRSEANVKSRVEVEAKVGVLRDKSSGQRLALPVLVETSMPQCPFHRSRDGYIDACTFQYSALTWIVDSNPTCHRCRRSTPFVFCANLTCLAQMQHKHVNTLLNELQANSTNPSHLSSPLTYSHKRLVDTFYQTDGHDKIRVTRDETGTVVDCMRKVRLGDLNVYSPKFAADWRISVNMEISGS
jgi:hypothetical protein